MAHNGGPRKNRNVRKRSEKSLHRKRLKTRKYRNSGWKLNYPDIFEEITDFPYIIRK
jgi:hypothetical protein